MRWIIVCSIIFSCCFQLGLSDCNPDVQCDDESDCSHPNYPTCEAGTCCQTDSVNSELPDRAIALPCTGGPCRGGRCRPGYYCTNGRCCKRTIIPIGRCPFFMVYTGQRCFGFGRKCRLGSCIGGVCCMRRITWRRCPKGQIKVSNCLWKKPRCPKGSSCVNGACCRPIITISKCPPLMQYTGPCFGTFCKRPSSCYKGSCCQSIFWPMPTLSFSCPAIDPAKVCASDVIDICGVDSDCDEGEKCCKVDCEPKKCIDVGPKEEEEGDGTE